MHNPDVIDKQLGKMLQENARQKSTALARKLHVSPSTIRRRVRRLVDNGIIRILAVPDPIKSGLPTAGMFGLKVDVANMDSVLASLSSKEEVLWLSTTTGRFDVIAIGRFSSNDHLASFIQGSVRGLEGVQDCETLVCLQVQKAHYVWK